MERKAKPLLQEIMEDNENELPPYVCCILEISQEDENSQSVFLFEKRPEDAKFAANQLVNFGGKRGN